MKTIFNFYSRKNGVDLSKVQAFVRILDAPSGNPVNPQPISPEDFTDLLKTAESNDVMTAILLVAMNCAFLSARLCHIEVGRYELGEGLSFDIP